MNPLNLSVIIASLDATSPGRGRWRIRARRGTAVERMRDGEVSSNIYLQNTLPLGYHIKERPFPAGITRKKGFSIMFDIFNMLKKDEAPAAIKQVTRETIIGDILDMDQSTAPYFMEIGMHCLGCPASRGESLEEACEVHGVDCDELIEKLNAHLASKKA